MNIRDEIVARRRSRIVAEGHALGCVPPRRREVPLVPFGRDPFVVCEIKRRSPSKGAIDEGLDPVSRAGLYIEGGARSLSILTEEDFFGGSLGDLLAVKKAYPGVSVLRKDFLFDEEDIEVSFRAGADAVLLIASVLGVGELEILYRKARDLGMEALVEVHSFREAEALKSLRPSLTGINARNLETFTVDSLHPPAVRGRIDWETRTVYESGIARGEDARLAGSLGFDGILVGEAAVRDPRTVPELIRGFEAGRGKPDRFWTAVAAGIGRGRPLVKICGLTNREDALAADKLGADLLGFVFAPSPRRADPSFVAALPPTRALRVGVVVLKEGEISLPEGVKNLLNAGALDAVQFHGEESQGLIDSVGLPSYKAVRPATSEEAKNLFASFRTPRILTDAFSREAYGGTGKRLSPEILAAARKAGPLWIAGGIGPGNIRNLARTWKPELVDVSSGLEERPGKKSGALMKRFFEELYHA